MQLAGIKTDVPNNRVASITNNTYAVFSLENLWYRLYQLQVGFLRKIVIYLNHYQKLSSICIE